MSSFADWLSQARRAEDAGDFRGAVIALDEALRLFELDPLSVEDPSDQYRRLGDLRVQLGQPSRAYAAYLRAAELSSEAGAASEVKELCVRMINVVPAAGDVYARFARRMYEKGHPGPALALLSEFAKRADDEVINEALDGARRTGGERRSEIESLLEAVERNTDAQGIVARDVMMELTGGEPVVRVPIPAPRAPSRLPEVSPLPPSPRPPVPAASSGSRVTATRVWGDVSGSAGKRKSTSFRIPWTYVGGAAGIAAVLVVMSIVRGGSGGGAPTNGAPVVALTPDSNQVVDSVVANDEAEVASQPPVTTTTNPAQNQPPPSTPASSPAAPAASPPVPQANADQSAPLDSSRLITQPIVAGSLTVRSVSPATFRGQQGFRVVHTLDSLSELIIESYPVDSAAAASYPIGTVIVNAVPPDTSVSIVRFDERYLVFASGVVPGDSMRVLIGLLRIGAQE